MFKKVHVSWCITAISLGLVVGICLSGLDLWRGLSLGGLVILGAALCVMSLLGQTRIMLAISLLGGLLLGVARGRAVILPVERRYNALIGDTLAVSAVVMDDPTISRGNLTFSAGEIEVNNISGEKTSQNLDGSIWVSIRGNAKILAHSLRRYDRVELVGALSEGFGSYGSVMARAKLKRIVRDPGADPLGRLRGWLGAQLGKAMGADEAALGMGLVAGQKASLSAEMKKAFTGASLTHILVASGYNLTILVRLSRRLFAKRSRLIALISSLTLIAIFSLMIGSSASMNRAVLVSVLSLITWYVGRTIHPVTLLALTSAITALLEPSVVTGDVGWYLSFMSFAGIILLAPAINKLVSGSDPELKTASAGWWNKLVRTIKQTTIETACASVFTIPIVAYFMGQISLTGIITGVLVLPVIPITMLATFVTGLVAAVLPVDIMAILATPAKLLLDYIILIAKWGASLPLSNIEYQPALGVILLYYGVLFIGVLILWRVTYPPLKPGGVIE